MVNRYTADWDCQIEPRCECSMEECKDGEYVRYEDYAALQGQVDELEADGGAAAWILEWMVAEQYRKPDIPAIVRKAHKHYKDTLVQVAQLQAQVDRIRNLDIYDYDSSGMYKDPTGCWLSHYEVMAAIKGEKS